MKGICAPFVAASGGGDEACTSSESEPVHRHRREEGIMGKLIVTEFVTLDGVAQAPGQPDEDRDGGFSHGGWQAPLFDEEAGGVVFEQARTMDALLLGCRTCVIFAGYWPTAPGEIPFTGLLNRVPKYVASRTLADPLAWHGSTLLVEPIAESVTSLQVRHDELHVISSLNLVQSLLALRPRRPVKPVAAPAPARRREEGVCRRDPAHRAPPD